ncbi:MAG: hypothetical protein P4M09_16910 [Devosia sp.]|nr:hypothetical protein [Devosia sp.]
MPISQQGAINTTALIVPDLYVQIVAPQVSLLNGVPTNVAGIVGTASWGPVNSPTTGANMTDYARQFGPLLARKYDMGTMVAAAVLQGASNFRFVRVTDGTDTAASVVVQTNCITFTSKYTGSLGNQIGVQLATGTQANTWKAIVSIPGRQPESFDNIGAGLSGNALWVAIASAINLGLSGLRGPSEIIVATAGAGVTTPSAASFTLSGGTDGVTSITSATLLGADTYPRSGMYALRNQGVSIAALADCDDSTSWATQIAFALAEGIYIMLVGPAGDTISGAVAAKATAGIDSYAAKLLFGDWVYFNDTVNGQIRLISPQGYALGRLANLSPQESSLNKQLWGIVGTQKSKSGLTYSSAELQSLAQAGIDVIANPVPGGNYFGVRIGHNASSDAVTQGDNYSRMTAYIAATINAGMGLYVGQIQNPKAQRNAKATLNAFFQALFDQEMIGSSDGSIPWQVILDGTNNPQSRVALGYMQADVKVIYLSIIEKFLINIEGGQSVQIVRQSTQSNT